MGTIHATLAAGAVHAPAARTLNRWALDAAVRLQQTDFWMVLIVAVYLCVLEVLVNAIQKYSVGPGHVDLVASLLGAAACLVAKIYKPKWRPKRKVATEAKFRLIFAILIGSWALGWGSWMYSLDGRVDLLVRTLLSATFIMAFIMPGVHYALFFLLVLPAALLLKPSRFERAWFARVDANGDGVVTRDEFEKAPFLYKVFFSGRRSNKKR